LERVTVFAVDTCPTIVGGKPIESGDNVSVAAVAPVPLRRTVCVPAPLDSVSVPVTSPAWVGRYVMASAQSVFP
jgi:hypothetical protein